MQDLSIIALISAVLSLSACDQQINNEMPTPTGTDDVAQRVDALEREVSAAAVNDRYQEKGMRLTKQTLADTNSYLAVLYENINSTRPQDLPEWQEMYEALTTDKALEDPEFGIGPRRLPTNFNKLHQRAEDQAAATTTLRTELEDNRRQDLEIAKALNVVQERLGTIDRNITDLNRVVEVKMAAIDKTLADYEGRIVGVENRMQTVEVDLDTFRQEFVSYRQRVNNLEDLLRRYNLAVMHEDIRSLKNIAINHDERIIDLVGKVQFNSAEISTNRNNLVDAEQQLATASSDIGTLKVAVEDIIRRLEEDGFL